MAFYGFVFAAALHHDHLHGRIPDRQTGLLQLTYQTQAIRLINDMLRHTAANNTPPSDALLMSILILAVHGQRQATTTDPPSRQVHPQSPLAKAQNLDFYGSLAFTPMHLAALHMLVERKGGLDKIELYGLADTLALLVALFFFQQNDIDANGNFPVVNCSASASCTSHRNFRVAGRLHPLFLFNPIILYR